jgi:CheY-like chemotaxis protein
VQNAHENDPVARHFTHVLFLSSMACESILVVEDDQDIRESIAEFLSMENYHVITASNGRDALDKLQSIRKPCLILLDLMMPVMSGQEFLKVRTDNVAIAAVPVVIVSAIADHSNVPKELVKGFVKKPINLDLLLKLVKTYCGEMQPPSEA